MVKDNFGKLSNWQNRIQRERDGERDRERNVERKICLYRHIIVEHLCVVLF